MEGIAINTNVKWSAVSIGGMAAGQLRPERGCVRVQADAMLIYR